MTHLSRKRWFGAVASLAAAYALVLNVVLSGMLLAAMSPTAIAAGYLICHNNPDLAAQTDDGRDTSKDTGKPAVHCPVCLGSHAPGAPPEVVAFDTMRIAIVRAPEVAADAAPISAFAPADHRVRAPPRLS
ncbi:MAG: DUF2946 family protein [Tardiphaga sp.]